ncbi:hypothetical protein ACVWYI_003033 [Bradyrhizobium sp. LB13.1]
MRPFGPSSSAVFGQAEAEPGIEFDGVLHFGCEHVEMVEPLRMASPVEVVAAEQMWPPVHRGIQLDLEAEGIGELQRAALERLIDERVAKTVLGQELCGLVQIPVIADFETEPVAGGHCRLAQHQRVMLMLFRTAQIHDLVVGVLDMQADGGLVERAAELQIGHIEDDVTRTDDVERRLEDMLRHGHCVSPL